MLRMTILRRDQEAWSGTEPQSLLSSENQRVPQRPQLDSRKHFPARQGILATDGLPMLHRAPAEDRRPDQGLSRPLRRPAHACNAEHAQPPWLSQHHESFQQPGPDPNPRYGGAEPRGEQAGVWIRIQDPVIYPRPSPWGRWLPHCLLWTAGAGCRLHSRVSRGLLCSRPLPTPSANVH